MSSCGQTVEDDSLIATKSCTVDFISQTTTSSFSVRKRSGRMLNSTCCLSLVVAVTSPGHAALFQFDAASHADIGKFC